MSMRDRSRNPRRARAHRGHLIALALLAVACAAGAAEAPATPPKPTQPAAAPPAASPPGPKPVPAPPPPPAAGGATSLAPGIDRPSSSGSAPLPGGAGIDPTALHAHVASLTWTHAVSYDENGLPSSDVRFEVALSIHADSDCMVDCGLASLTSATTDTGEKLAPLAPTLEWAQGGDDPTADLICRLDFAQPAKPAKSLTFSGTVRVAPPEAVRVADIQPIGEYLGKWLALQGLPGGMVHPYLLNDAVWFQFSPQLAAVFHSIHYRDAGGADIDIPDWNDSPGAQPAYTNGISPSAHAAVSIGYLDQAKCCMLPFSFTDLPLDGAPIGRQPAPAHADAAIPTHPAADRATEKAAGVDHF